MSDKVDATSESPDGTPVFVEAPDAGLFSLFSKSKKGDTQDAIGGRKIPVPIPIPKKHKLLPPLPRFPFDDADYFYKMTHPHRGIALIFNYEHFSSKRRDNASERQGSSVDAANLVATFSHLGFEVRHYDNLKSSETLAVLNEVATSDHSLNDCLAVAVLSHGVQDSLGETAFYTYDKKLSINDDLVASFTGSYCTSLRAKPKLFFIQACQGTNTDKGFYVVTDSLEKGMQPPGAAADTISYPRIVHLPDEADVLISYSTPPGYFSWRNSKDGSWFISELCSSLGRWGFELNILDILTRVCHNVAVSYASQIDDRRFYNKKQCPTVVSRLTKELKFTPAENSDRNDGQE